MFAKPAHRFAGNVQWPMYATLRTKRPCPKNTEMGNTDPSHEQPDAMVKLVLEPTRTRDTLVQLSLTLQDFSLNTMLASALKPRG